MEASAGIAPSPPDPWRRGAAWIDSLMAARPPWAIVAFSQAVLAAQAPPIYSGLPSWLQAVVTNLFLVLPALAVMRIITATASWPAKMVIILWSALSMVVAVILARSAAVALGIALAPFSAWSFWAGCALVVEALWAVVMVRHTDRAPRARRPPPARSIAGPMCVGIGAYVLASWGSSAVVPAQQDQDMVLVCPTYGLFTHLAPYGLETRYPYQFNKPPALYFLTGASIALRGELDSTRPFCLSGRNALPLMKKDPRIWKERLHDLREQDIQRFFRVPRLTASVRIPTRGIAVLFAVTLFLFFVHFGASAPFSALLTAAIITLPEVFIRASFAGFTTVSLLELLVILWLYLWQETPHRGRLLWAASLLLALTNHKPLFIVPVFMLADLAACRRGPILTTLYNWGRLVWRTGIAPGALLGTAAYWMYGAAINWEIFREDHVYRDILFRFIRGHDGSYPTLVEVWLQWVRNTSFVILPLGAACLLCLVWRRRSFGLVLMLWCIVGGALASIVDWKQTKHLMLSLPPLAVAPGLCWPGLRKATRAVIASLLAITIMLSVYALSRLAHDFTWLPPSKVW